MKLWLIALWHRFEVARAYIWWGLFRRSWKLSRPPGEVAWMLENAKRERGRPPWWNERLASWRSDPKAERLRVVRRPGVVGWVGETESFLPFAAYKEDESWGPPAE